MAKDSPWNSSGWNSTGSNRSSNASSTPKKAVDVKLFEVENNILDDYIEIFISKPNFLVKAFLCYDLQIFNEKFVKRLFDFIEQNQTP